MYIGISAMVKNRNAVVDYVTCYFGDKQISLSWDESEYGFEAVSRGYYEYELIGSRVSYTDDDDRIVYPDAETLTKIMTADRFELCLRDKDTETPEKDFCRMSIGFEAFDSNGCYYCFDVPADKIFVEGREETNTYR